MPIHLVTGLPGAGKSLGAVERIVQFQEKEPDRPVYVLGIDGLKDGVAAPLTADQLREWWELPTGSIIVVDEAQKYFPARRSGDPPQWVRKLSEHRHFGLDFVLCTQSPVYLDSYLRGLVDRHTHLVRKFGTGIVDRYEWPAVCGNPLSKSERRSARKSLWRYPKRCFDLYKSAELHTVKRRIPFKVYVLLAVPFALAVAAVVVVKAMHKGGGAGGSVVAAAAGPSGVSQAQRSGDAPKWATPADYVKDHLPRVANQPWSAPVYDGQAVAAKPDLMCIEHENPGAPGEMLCHCYTEQVTPYELHSLAECRRYARHGVYNPRRAPFAQQSYAQASDASGSPASPAATGDAPSAGAAQGGHWQPEWRTREYVQPERTSASGGPHISGTWGG